MVYIVFCRYEVWTAKGKEFCKWHQSSQSFTNKELANKYIENIKESICNIDKKTKLKHEYEIRCVDEVLLAQSKLIRPKGRPKQIDISYLDELSKKLNKKSIVKINDDIKCYLYNDEKAQNYISSKIKDKSKYTRYWYDDKKNLFIILKDKNTENIIY